MRGETISILIANYNNAEFLEECVDSVLDQTSDRWDIRIVDDASTDRSEEIYVKYDDRSKINISYNKENIGLVRTLKKLIALSKSDIVGILDTDDKLDSTCVEKVADYYDRHPSAGFVYTNFWYCDEKMNINKLGFCKPIRPGQTNLELDCVSHFKTFRKSVYEKTKGYDENILYAEDKDLIFKMEEVTRLHFIDEPLYYYRVRRQSQAHGPYRAIGKKNCELAKQNARVRRGLANL